MQSSTPVTRIVANVWTPDYANVQELVFGVTPEITFATVKAFLEEQVQLKVCLWNCALAEVDLTDVVGVYPMLQLYGTSLPLNWTDPTLYIGDEELAILGPEALQPLRCTAPEVVKFARRRLEQYLSLRRGYGRPVRVVIEHTESLQLRWTDVLSCSTGTDLSEIRLIASHWLPPQSKGCVSLARHGMPLQDGPLRSLCPGPTVALSVYANGLGGGKRALAHALDDESDSHAGPSEDPLEKAWKGAENRVQFPRLREIEHENRQELICKEGVMRVLDRTSSRLCSTKRGNLVALLAEWLHMGEDHPSDPRVLILRTTVYRPVGQLTRLQSGTASAWPDLPPRDVMEWLAPQIDKGIKRTRVGKSPFSDGSTVRFILRDALPQPMMDSDIQRAYATFRYLRLPEELRSKYPRLAEFVRGCDIIDALVECFKECVTPPPPKGAVKVLLLMIMNLGSFEGWLKKFDLTTHPAKLASGDAVHWLEEFTQEMRRYITWWASLHPEKLEELSLSETKPQLALLRHADEADEARCINAVEIRFPLDDHLSNEFDGVHAPLLAETREEELAARQLLIPIDGVVLTDKVVDLMEHLQARFPTMNFDKVSPVSGEEFLKFHSWCRKALKAGPRNARERTTYFMKCVYSVLHDSVKRTRKENTFQLFDVETHSWITGSRDRFQRWVQDILFAMFHHPAADGEEPLPPLGQGEFTRSILHDLSSYLPMAGDDNFDGEGMRHKIQYADKRVKDYRTKEVRWAEPSDRARLHTNAPYVDLEAPEQLKALWRTTVQLMIGFWQKGGTSFNVASAPSAASASADSIPPQTLERDNDAAAIVQNLQTLASHDAFHLLAALKAQWTAPSGSDVAGWDTVIYILRHLARAFSSHEHFTEMINMTGRRNSGKSYVVMLVSKFLGDGNMNYTGTLDKDYLSSPPAKASSNADSGRNPALAQNRNKRFTVIPDSPNGYFRSDIMKPLVEQKGEKVQAAHNYAGADDDRDFHPTFLLWRVSNYELRVDGKDADPGVMDKVNELRVPVRFVASNPVASMDEILVEAGLEGKTLKGGFSACLDFLTTWLYDTLNESVCKDRHIRPKPKIVSDAETEMVAGGLVEHVRAFYLVNTTPVEKNGTPFTEMNTVLGAFAGVAVDGNVQREAGVLLKAGSRSGNIKVHKFNYPDGMAQALLKPPEERIPWSSLIETAKNAEKNDEDLAE